MSADTAKDNRKSADTKRYFVLALNAYRLKTGDDGVQTQVAIPTVQVSDDVLTLHFAYQEVIKDGKELKTNQEQINHETVQYLRASNDVLGYQEIFAPCPSAKNPTRTLLEKHLTDYSTKNTADYFIHKDLGAFLNHELDFYIKNEVMHLDNIDHAKSIADIEHNLTLTKLLRKVAKEVIALLAQLEDFQKKLWLKKKFVVDCHYLVTLDKFLPALTQGGRDEKQALTVTHKVLGPQAQRAAWQELFAYECPLPPQICRG